MSASDKKQATSKYDSWIDPSSWNPRTILIIVGAFTAVGFVLRIWNVDGLTLWVDEYVHVLRAKWFIDGSGDLFTNDNNGILLTMVLIPLFKLFGATAFMSRLPSVLFGVACIPLTYLLGKRLFNRHVGMMAALLNALSLYLVFWSRVTRNYAIFEFFFLLLLLVFLEAFEPRKRLAKLTGFWHKNQIDPLYTLLIPVFLIPAVLSHQLAFFFVFCAGAYFAFTAIFQSVGPKPEGVEKRSFKNKYTILGGVFLFVAALLFLPFMSGFTTGLLGLFLPDFVVKWVVPDWEHLGTLMDTKPHEAFDRYAAVITYDLKNLYLLSFVGLVAGLFYNRRSTAFMVGFYVVPFLLLSYLFREPFVPRYILFTYPVYLISIAVALYALVKLLQRYVFKKATLISASFFWLIPAVIIVTQVHWGELNSLMQVKKRYANVIDRSLSHWSFTNWVQSLDYVKTSYQPGDIIMSTVPSSAQFYLNDKDVLWFRQRKYSPEAHGYVLREYDTINANSAFSYENLVQTVESNPRGWLVADYYLYGPLTDPRCRDYVIQNFHYHFNTSPDGDVYVFSWDRSNPQPGQAFVAEVGKGGKRASRELQIQLSNPQQYNFLVFYLEVEGVDFNEEAILVFNQSYQQFIPATTNGVRQQVGIRVDAKYLKNGENTIQFGYYPKNERQERQDVNRGFAVYNINVAGAG